MIHEAVRSFMVQVFGSVPYGIWIKDEYDFQWNNWLREGELPEYTDQEQIESSWKILRYTFVFCLTSTFVWLSIPRNNLPCYRVNVWRL